MSTRTLSEREIFIKNIWEWREAKPIALSMESNCGPKRSSVNIDIACIYTEDLSEAHLEHFTHEKSLKMISRDVSLSVQMMSMSNSEEEW